jgi:lipoprotein-releasing system permease protein
MVQDWQELNQSLFSAMALEKIAVFIALLCVILVASFGILGSNLMSVLEKSKEIAILKTMGCTDRLIQRVFIAEGLCMGDRRGDPRDRDGHRPLLGAGRLRPAAQRRAG